jgi:HEAT repeat protein
MRRVPSVLLFLLFVPVLAAASDLDRLAKDLKSRDTQTRADAAKSLGRLKSEAAVELLVTALSDREGKVRSAAASALWHASDVSKAAIPALRKTLFDPDPYVVACAAGALIAMDVPREEVADALRGVLQRGDPFDRFLAARGLTGVEPAAHLVAPLVEHLRRNVPDQNDVGSFFDRKDRFDSAAKALKHLGQTNDRTQIDPLMAELRAVAPAIIPPILAGLGELKPAPDHWVDTLIDQLGSAAVPVRRQSLELLRKQLAAADIRKWAPPVARLTKDADAEIRGWAIGTLGDGKGLAHEAFGAVLQMIGSERDAHLRARAADVAGDIGDAKYPIDSALKASMGKEGFPVLTAAIAKDPDADVRGNALHSLAKLQIEPSETAPVFARAAVEGKGVGFRTDALILLSNLGHDFEQATAMIEPLANDPDPLVSRIAKETVKSMRSGSTSSSRKATTPAVAQADPAARERALATLREKDVQFTTGDFARALRELEEETVAAFLDAGMSPNQRFSYGGLPLQTVLDSQYECGKEMKSTVRLLIDRGADANGSDDAGNTIIMTAAKQCDGEMIKMLIKAGAKVQAKNSMGFGALDDAIPMANTSAATALIAAGARLTPEMAKSDRETYKKQPKVLEIIAMATKK